MHTSTVVSGTIDVYWSTRTGTTVDHGTVVPKFVLVGVYGI